MDAKEWLAVNALPGMGATRIAQLVARKPQWPQGWLAALPSNAANALRLWLAQPERSPLQQAVDETLAWLQKAPRRCIATIPHGPPCLINCLTRRWCCGPKGI